MKSFALKVLGFAAIQLAIATLLIVWKAPQAQDYLAAVNFKQTKLREQAPPRVIFVGGSNIAFSLNSNVIREKLNRNPINMGLIAGLGLNFMLNETADSMRAGDVVVLSLEYEHFFESTVGDSLLDVLIAHRPSAIRYIDLSAASKLSDKALPYFSEKYIGAHLRGTFGEKPETRDIYKLKNFNQYGDHTSHWNLPGTYQYESVKVNRFLNNPPGALSTIRRLNQLEQECRRKNVTVLLTYPAIQTERQAEVGPKLAAFDTYLRRHLQIPIITKPGETAYPASDFFDTYYHLAKKTTIDERSALVANRIEAAISKKR